MNMKNNNLYNNDYVEIYKKKKKEGRLDRLKSYFNLQKDDVVLDLGCGSGFLLDLIKNDVKSYVGIDLSQEFIAESKITHKKNTESFFCESSKEHASKYKNHYNKIFLMDVTEHLDDETMVGVINDCYKMLKNNGQIIIHTPNGLYFLELLKHYGIIKQTTGHIAIRAFSQYKELIKKSRFSTISVRYINHYINLLKPLHMLSVMPFIGQYFQARLLMIVEK